MGLIGVIPGTGKNNSWYSHRGLTFGGIISNQTDLYTQLSLISKLNYFLKENNYNESIITLPSDSFYSQSSPTWFYAYTQNLYKLVRTDINQFIPTNSLLPSKKITNAKSAERKGAVFSLDIKYAEEVFKIIQDNLRSKYGNDPVHSFFEINMLSNKFLDEIKICSVIVDDEILAGAIVFESKSSLHIQYIGATQNGKKIRAQDFLIYKLKNLSPSKILSFGKSTSGEQAIINMNLFNFKNEFNTKNELICTFICDLKSNNLPVY